LFFEIFNHGGSLEFWLGMGQIKRCFGFFGRANALKGLKALYTQKLTVERQELAIFKQVLSKHINDGLTGQKGGE